MTTSPTNFHPEDPRRGDRSPLDPTPILDLMSPDARQYGQMLSNFVLQPRHTRQVHPHQGGGSADPSAGDASYSQDSPFAHGRPARDQSPAYSEAGYQDSGHYSSRYQGETGFQRETQYRDGGRNAYSDEPHQRSRSNPLQPQRGGSNGRANAPERKPMWQRPAIMRHSFLQYLVAGGCILSALALMTDVHSLMPSSSSVELCQTVVQPDSILSRETLAKLLAVSERSPKTSVQQVISEPYCQLPVLELRAGVTAEREAYPLAFDPDTWFVVLYEGNEYAGYDFSFRQ